MTARYTTDPFTVAATARTLRADPAGFFPRPFVVSCGYAARRLYTAGSKTNNLFIVRLKDGAGWLLRGNANPQIFSYGPAIGISCTDVYATAQFMDNGAAIIRIPLSKLGTPLPPS